MPAFDLTLTDPPVNAVAGAMEDAVEAANLRCRVGLLKADRAEYDAFLRKEFAAPEGIGLWLAEKGRVETYPPTPRSTLLGLVWRTTPLGSRIVHIAGRRIEPFKENAANRFGPPWQVWPPMCYLDDHIVVRTLAGGKPEAVAICECGVVGPPEQLNWMKGRCGPCHDHLEEHGTSLADSEGPVVLRTQGRLTDVGFSPSGQTVAAVEWVEQGRFQVAIWERKTAACRHERAEHQGGRLMSSSATGVMLQRRGELYWLSDRANKPQRWRSSCSCVSATTQGTVALALDYSGAMWQREMTDDDAEWTPLWPERRDSRDVIYAGVAVAPNGTLALGKSDCSLDLVDRSGKGPTLQPLLPGVEFENQRLRALAFSPDGKRLAGGAGRSGFVDDPREEWWGRSGGIHLFDAVSGMFLFGVSTPNDDIMAVAWSPDGSLLFYGSTDCMIHVLDVDARQEIAVLSGHVGDVNALAFSADGETLASAAGDGLVRLWPWRLLLGRPARPNAVPVTEPSESEIKPKRASRSRRKGS